MTFLPVGINEINSYSKINTLSKWIEIYSLELNKKSLFPINNKKVEVDEKSEERRMVQGK